jgi:putative aminopeptidase FrvX
MPNPTYQPPQFLIDLLAARAPSGAEFESQAAFDRHVEPAADEYRKDVLGNRIAVLNPAASPILMLAGHLDELGLLITYVNPDGFLYFDTLGGHDKGMIPGRRVIIRTANGNIKGITGKRAIHLMSVEDRKRVPETHEMWIDIGAKSKADALARVRIGDTVTYDHEFEMLAGSIGTARAFDNKAGAYIIGETLIRLAAAKKRPTAQIVAVGTAQEEVGVRGATTSTFSVNPHVAIAVDVGHATDHPDCDNRKYGEFKLGGGPMICRGPNINPLVFDRLIKAAQKAKITYQIEADARPTGTDARAMQISRDGVATGLVSVPLRYMHTPSEMVDLEDIEAAVKLLVEFAKGLKKDDRFEW